MKIRKYVNRNKEIGFLIGAIVLVILIVIYVFLLVRGLSMKAGVVFGPPQNVNVSNADFDFPRYEALMKKYRPSSSIPTGLP